MALADDDSVYVNRCRRCDRAEEAVDGAHSPHPSGIEGRWVAGSLLSESCGQTGGRSVTREVKLMWEERSDCLAPVCDVLETDKSGHTSFSDQG